MWQVDQAINVLDRLLCTVVFVAVIFVFVAFLNANFTTTLATTGTALLSLSFVFSVTCQEVLGCVYDEPPIETLADFVLAHASSCS